MQKLLKLLTILLLDLWSTHTFAQTPPTCQGTILAIFRRPTVITSACTVPQGHYSFESGVNTVQYRDKSHGLVLPQARFRVGLPALNELVLSFPNEITNNKTASGLSPSQISLKHDLFYGQHWNTAVRAIYTPASGSKAFGAPHNGYTLNFIMGYLHQPFNVSAMIGYSSLVTPHNIGGQRFNTWSPDVAVGWQAKDWVQLYAEVYGQLNTGPRHGPGYNVDAGFLFLFNKYIEADLELGHRINGRLANLRSYLGAGFSFMI